jgi:energy-coupling factor transporter ATP-binding protein EcfA2
LDRPRSEGRTVIIAAHDVRRLGPLCDRVALLEGGRLVKAGPVATTLREVVEKLGGTAVEDGEDSVTTVGPDSTSADGGGPVVEVEALRFAYPTNGFNLGPLSFAIEAGERVALLGPNGGGKTTLLSLLAGQLSPQKGGNLRVCGIDPRSRARRRLPALVSLVTQNPDLMLHSPTVEREIAARPRYLRLPVGRHRQEVTGILAGFDLERLAQKHPFSLSQGQRQRLAMAAAISGGARLLMVDEPTTGQDMRQRGALLRRIRRLADAGLAVLFSTHSLEAALAAAGRAMVIEKGKLIFDGPITALRRNQQLLDLAGLDLPPAVGGGPGSS